MVAADTESGQLAQVQQELAALRDLFQRRLLEDKAKNRLYDELVEQLSAMRGALSQDSLAPVFRQLLLVIDRMESQNAGDERLLASVADELREILERHGVHPVAAKTKFDPSIHEAASAVSEGGVSPGTILKVVRPGYSFGERLLRPERVIVASK